MINFKHLKRQDKEVYKNLVAEYKRQNSCIELIASENVPSEAVLEAQASYHSLKYAEGYPHKRYYAGCENIDEMEQLAIDRACKLFGARYANVQPHSGAQANTAVEFALLKPKQTLMGMSLNSGGHLTHGAAPTFSGKMYKSVQYDVNSETGRIDYEDLEKKINKHKPRLFIAGASAYPRQINFEKIREIIDAANLKIREGCSPEEYEEKKIYFMVDMAHIAGLVAAGLHQSPVPYADVVTTTTHKTLRGPRGGLILWNDDGLTQKINAGVFPGIQGGPLEQMIMAKAVCFGEAMSDEFKYYQSQVVGNAQALAEVLMHSGVSLLTGGTSNHLLLVDLRTNGISGAEVEERLASINIITNKNAVPFDEKPKNITSGLRIGTPAVTSRGFGTTEMQTLGHIIADAILLDKEHFELNKKLYINEVRKITKKFPI